MSRLRFDPQSIMASPEKAALVDSIRRARVRRRIEEIEAMIQAGDIPDDDLRSLIAVCEGALIVVPDGHHRSVFVPTRAERDGFKRLAALAIGRRGGRFAAGRDVWVADAKGMRRVMA